MNNAMGHGLIEDLLALPGVGYDDVLFEEASEIIPAPMSSLGSDANHGILRASLAIVSDNQHQLRYKSIELFQYKVDNIIFYGFRSNQNRYKVLSNCTVLRCVRGIGL